MTQLLRHRLLAMTNGKTEQPIRFVTRKDETSAFNIQRWGLIFGKVFFSRLNRWQNCYSLPRELDNSFYKLQKETLIRSRQGKLYKIRSSLLPVLEKEGSHSFWSRCRHSADPRIRQIPPLHNDQEWSGKNARAAEPQNACRIPRQNNNGSALFYGHTPQGTRCPYRLWYRLL